jgi:hypothetical protein
MAFGAVDRFLRDEDWIIEGERKRIILTSKIHKVAQNNLIGAPGYHHVLAIPHQHTNKLVTPDSSRF